MTDFRLKLLSLICSKDGQLSWYQIDRALALDGIERTENLMQSLNSLELDGLIIKLMQPNLSQPKYSITPDGVKTLAEKPLADFEK